jgi:hypothetical protein
MAAPAAPRMVLCESTVNFQSSKPAGAQPADGSGHAVAAILVQPRLRTIFGRDPLDGLGGGGGQILTASGLNSAQAASILRGSLACPA